jgi:hypothetical protein
MLVDIRQTSHNLPQLVVTVVVRRGIVFFWFFFFCTFIGTIFTVVLTFPLRPLSQLLNSRRITWAAAVGSAVNGTRFY